MLRKRREAVRLEKATEKEVEAKDVAAVAKDETEMAASNVADEEVRKVAKRREAMAEARRARQRCV